MTIQREGRFTDTERGGGIVQGYRDAVREDPFNKGFIARNLRQYGTLKRAGVGTKKGLKKLKGLSDTQMENIAAKAVLKKAKVKTRRLPTRYNRKKHNVKWAKKVMARRQQGLPVKKRALKRTKLARAHVRRIDRNRQVMKKPIYRGVPKPF